MQWDVSTSNGFDENNKPKKRLVIDFQKLMNRVITMRNEKHKTKWNKNTNKKIENSIKAIMSIDDELGPYRNFDQLFYLD